MDVVPLDAGTPITKVNASEYSSPPSLNGFKSPESRGPDSEPATFYRRVVKGWIYDLASPAPDDIPAVWDGSPNLYARVCKRWRTLVGDGQRRVKQRQEQTKRAAALAPPLPTSSALPVTAVASIVQSVQQHVEQAESAARTAAGPAPQPAAAQAKKLWHKRGNSDRIRLWMELQGPSYDEMYDGVDARVQEPADGQTDVSDRLMRLGFVDGSLQCTNDEYSVQCASGRFRRWSI